MIRCGNFSIWMLVTGFVLVYLASTLSIPGAAHIAGLCIVFSLCLYRRLSPVLGSLTLATGFLLTLVSPSPYILASLFPLLGFFFSGKNKYPESSVRFARYGLLTSISCMYITSMLLGFESAEASHNSLSAIVAFALLAEFLYFGRPSRFYIILIFFSFFVFGNRSSLFLLGAFIKGKILLTAFLLGAAFFILITLGVASPPDRLNFLFDLGGLFFRSYADVRVDYIDEFIREFSFFDLTYSGWSFSGIPVTSSGFYDLHNSFLTIIVRDSYLGILKVIFWLSLIFSVPFSLFLAVTLRAFYDTFLLGGILDSLVYALIGQSIVGTLIRLSAWTRFGWSVVGRDAHSLALVAKNGCIRSSALYRVR